MRRSTYSTNDKTRIITIFLCIALVAGAAWAATSDSAGNFISKNILKPIFSNDDNGETEVVEKETTEKVDTTAIPSSSSNITQTIDFPAFSIYGIQLGAYSTLENATSAANIITMQGGGGYIIEEEGLYRVLATAYYNENDARNVKEKLIQDGYDAYLKPVLIDGISLNITAEQGQIEVISNAHSAWLNSAETLAELSLVFDDKTLSRSQLDIMLLEQSQLLDDAAKTLTVYKDASEIIETLYNQLTLGKNTINSISDTSLSDSELSSRMKYIMIDSLYRFSEYAKSIS